MPSPLTATRHASHSGTADARLASPDLIHVFAYEGRAHDDDPRWEESGAPDLATYGRWVGHMCGIACLRMALMARTGDAPTMFELLNGARKRCVHRGPGHRSHPRPDLRPLRPVRGSVHSLGAEVRPNLTMTGLLTLLDDGRMVMASVHKEIRRPQNPAPGKGGHLVLVTGRQGDIVHSALQVTLPSAPLGRTRPRTNYRERERPWRRGRRGSTGSGRNAGGGRKGRARPGAMAGSAPRRARGCCGWPPGTAR